MRQPDVTRVLVANRGEIAVRIMRACHRLGLETVAVYSDADARAPHVQLATTAVHLGATPARESYLDVDKVLAAARTTGADALHPGYGFLSENPQLADRCREEGITFVGPGGDAMRAMGDKQRAKQVAAATEVPTVPVYAADSVPADAYPVLVKASAGGGGRGMRVVESPAALAEALDSARREAAAGFGDDTLLIERLVTGARHVEVQLLADSHGNALYVGDRDCSLQRRHQKVVEEAPAPGLSYEQRRQLGEATVRMARHTGYVNAGTAEFLVSPSGEWFFLELNARLQVEHPVTELVFGLDLVEWQLRIARGEAIDFQQEDLRPLGTAIEARIYAEDPVTYLPTGGRLLDVQLPSGEGIRIDHALQSGADVSLAYDPLLAKVVASGATREAARERLLSALRETSIVGVTTNQALLQHALELQPFRHATHTIDTLGKNRLPDHATEPPPALVAAAQRALAAQAATQRRGDPFVSGASATVERRLQAVAGWGEHVYFTVDGVGHSASRDHMTAGAGGAVAATHGDQARLTTPMPGTIIKTVDAGVRVEGGEPVVVLEAMKMENAIAAPFDATVDAIHCSVGDIVGRGTVVAELSR